MQPTWVSKDAQTFLIALLVLKFIGHNIIKLFGELQFYCIGKEKQVNYNYLIVGHNQGAAVLYMAKQFSPHCTAQHYRDVHVSHFTCHISCVTCLVSHVTCHMSRFTCRVSHVFCLLFFSFFLKQSGGASWWRVCYQWGLPRVVLCMQ